MPSLNDPLRTGDDFNVAFNALLDSAQRFGVDVLNEANRQFLQHAAEVAAENHAQMRRLYNVLNRPLTG